MKRNLCIGLMLTALAALGVSQARAQEACCGGAACGACAEGCTASKICLRAEIVPQKYKVQTPVKTEVKVTTKEEEREVPVCKMVPVTVTDPCTGCTHTEYKEETTVEKVKATIVESCPESSCTTKEEEKTRYCTNVYIEYKPVAAPACPAGGCCGH